MRNIRGNIRGRQMRFRQWVLAGLVAGLSVAASGANAQTYLPGADFAIACENGANYRLTSGVVAIPGHICISARTARCRFA
jgi:hypothetical protein